eukprot:GHVU01102738.1.p1 GENE.GHVU01102738.1~~GHVU01102738.1.p1  ORF type:complete len:197 (-),score=19.72 GHVU01102738.1:348-938(-)
MTAGAMAGTMDFARDEYFGSLEEPVRETIMRDVRSVGKKLHYVLLPRARAESGSGLKQWDLWGPLLLCLTLSVILWLQASYLQRKLVFSLVFIVVWVGAAVVTANAVLLGGNMSFFQCVCVLGYCICPLDIAAAVCYLIPPSLHILKLILVVVALHWSTGASVAFMAELVPGDRKTLAIYPVWLFYVVIAWLILLI